MINNCDCVIEVHDSRVSFSYWLEIKVCIMIVMIFKEFDSTGQDLLGLSFMD